MRCSALYLATLSQGDRKNTTTNHPTQPPTNHPTQPAKNVDKNYMVIAIIDCLKATRLPTLASSKTALPGIFLPSTWPAQWTPSWSHLTWPLSSIPHRRLSSFLKNACFWPLGHQTLKTVLHSLWIGLFKSTLKKLFLKNS